MASTTGDGTTDDGTTGERPAGELRARTATATRTAPRATLDWLEGELAVWQAEGRLDAATAAAIRGSYVPGRRVPLGRLLLLLGAGFVAVGVLWLGAANLEQLSPAVRFAGVVALWASAVVVAEVLAGRRDRAAPGAGPPGATGASSTAVGGARLVAAVVFGGVVFQAAQSLQVPAYDPGLVGLWSVGALLYAYATVGVAPLLVGIATAVGWCLWTVADRSPSGAVAAVVLLVAGLLAAGLAAAHSAGRLPRPMQRFAGPWRAASALLVLTGLFLLALPDAVRGDVGLPTGVWAGAAVVLIAAAAAAAVTDRTGQLEVAVAVAALAAGWALLQWAPSASSLGSGTATLAGLDLLRAAVLLLLFVLVCVWYAALGVLRDAERLTSLATAALVLFTVTQSFAVFSTILSGAALFLVLGAVLVVTGWGVGQGRRRLVADVREVAA